MDQANQSDMLTVQQDGRIAILTMSRPERKRDE